MSFESIHNYYEQRVLDQISELTGSILTGENEDFLCDVACLALNQLPSRYVRHNVDMIFYMSIQEREHIQQDVHKAVSEAIDYINCRRNDMSQATR